MNRGILCPLSCLPSNHGIGDLGKEAYSLIDLLADSGINYLQILPFHPSTQANSPYRGVSTYAGDEIYIDLNNLVELGLLENVPDFNKDASRVDYDAIRKFKHKYLLIAYKNFKGHNDYDEFLKKCPWVFDYAVYCTFANLFNTYDWTSWSEEYKNYPSSRLVSLSKYSNQIGYYQFVQFIFYCQWFSLKDYANSKGISFFGDMPFYVDHGSVEVWLEKEEFLLDELGNPTCVAGVPPDYFSPTGQLWGNPIYDWDYLKEHNFNFWVKRIGWASKIFDITRIDHFRAFDSYWSVPSTSKTAMEGKWFYAPGYELFDTLYDKLGKIHLVAEDLGYLREEVIELKDHYHLSGMKVFQFMLDEGYDDLENAFFYTGTHDNDTLVGWVNSLNDYDLDKIKDLVGVSYPVNQAIMHYCLHSKATDVIIPIWDLLQENTDCRFNVPGSVSDDNWTYRINDFNKIIQGFELLKKLKSEE